MHTNTPCNPCSCVGTHTLPPVTPSCKPNKCMQLGHILIEECNSVGPCGNIGTIDLSCYKYTCDNPEIKVYSNSHPELIEVVNITKSTFTFKTTSLAKGGERVQFTIFAKCKGDCLVLSDYSTITIYIKDLCRHNKCTSTQKCNKCTGVCEELDPEILISDKTIFNTPIISNEIFIS